MQNKGNILLVDDEAEVLSMYKRLLREFGFYIHDFLSPLDALSFLKFTDKNIELIITDLNMPIMDGLQFVKKIRKIPNFLGTPIVYLTGIDDQNLKLAAFRYGAVDYLQKPINTQLFIAKINSIIHSYRLNTFQPSILMKGNQKTFSVEEIIKYCEQEKISGFAAIVHDQDQGQLTFEKGVLKEITTDGLTDSDAFEKMLSWPEFRFLIARGPFNESAVQFLETF